MNGSFWMIMCIAMVTMAAIRRDQAPVDEATRAERSRKFRAIAVILAGVGAIVYAGFAALGSLGVLYDLTMGHGPRSMLLFLMVPGLAVASVLLGWIGLLLLRDKDLPGRLARTWSAAVEAFFEPIPEGGKPKSSRHELD